MKGSLGIQEKVIRGILRHLIEYPDAKDTFDGIFKFWLPADVVHQGRNKVREAIDVLLFTKGWLTERKSGSSETFYSLNKDRLGEIKDFLRHSSNGN